MGQQLTQPVVARVTDAGGRGVPNVSVSFTPGEGDGSFTPSTALTDDAGEALAVWTLGIESGPAGATVEVEGLGAVSLTATARPGEASRLRFETLPTAAMAGVVLDPPVAVAVEDEHGNAVPDVRAEVRLELNQGELAGPTAAGTVDGIATFSGLRIDQAGSGYVLTAFADGIASAGTGEFSVQPAPIPEVAEVVVTPAQTALLVEQTVTLAAAALDAQGAPVPGATVTWSSSDPAVAGISPTGVVTAVEPGVATITATSGNLSGSAAIAVALGGGTYPNVSYCTMDGTQVLMDVYVPDATAPRPLPAVVHVHGGGWTGGSKSSGPRFAELMPLLLQRGYLVASLDYRLAPADKYPAQIQDVKCAVRHLRARASRYSLDPERIGAWGGSAGGQLVSLLGTEDASVGLDDLGDFLNESSAVQAVVAISAITDFTHPDELNDDYSRAFQTWPDPESPEMIEASPVTHISPGDAPFFLIVGEDDDLVLPAQSERMHELLRSAGVPSTLLTVLNADHDLLPTDGPTDPPSAVVSSRMADFFDQHLR